MMDRTHWSDTTPTLLQHSSQAGRQNTLINHNTHTVTALFIGWWTEHTDDQTQHPHCYITLHRLMDRTHCSDTTPTLLHHTSQTDGQNTLLRHNTHTVTSHFTGWETEHTEQTQHPHCYSTLHRLGDRTHCSDTTHTLLNHSSQADGQNTLFRYNTHTVTALFIGWGMEHTDQTQHPHCYSTLHRLMDRTHWSVTTPTLLQHTLQADGQNTLIRHNTHTVTAHFTGWWTEHTDQTQHPHCYSTLHRLGDRTHCSDTTPTLLQHSS